MEKGKIYLPMQIKALMPSDMYKVLDVLVAFQKEGIVSYSKRNAEFLHMDEAICDQAVQTAVDVKLFIPVGKDGGVFKFKINEDIIKRAQEVSLKDIPGKKMISLSTNITFKSQKKEEKKDVDCMSYDEMKKMLLMLQARMNEHEQVKKLVVNNSDEDDGLPF